jgi:hypothetical protein
MKKYEYLLVIINVTLIYFGLALFDSNMGLSVTAFIIVGVLFCSYIYFVKTAPMKHLKQLFIEMVTANGFQPVSVSATKKDVIKQLRLFPGFDDLFLSVDELYTLENESALYFAGSYSISGYGINSGYFVLGNLQNSANYKPVKLSRFVDKIDKFDAASEQALAQLPNNMIKVLLDFPYDCHFIDYYFLADFDSRNLNKHNFQDSFYKIIF